MSKLALSRRFRRLGAALALFSLVADGAGCVERRMTIRSNPPGAAVYVDDYQIGTTPVATDYTYYGTRKVRLVKDGFETLTVYQPMPPPWYQYFGIDFFSENIWPGKIRDERAYDYQMSPLVMVAPDQLLGRAEQLRNSGRVMQAGAEQPVVAPPVTLPPGTLQPGTLPPPGTLPQESLPAPSTQPYLPPAGTYQQPSTISPPINSAPYMSPSNAAPSYAAPGGSGSAVYPPPGNAPPTYTLPPNMGPNFASPGGFGAGGSMPPSAAPSPLFPSQPAPTGIPQYAPPAAAPSAPPPTAPPAAAPPTAVPPYSVPPGWRPMGQLPATPDAPITR